ncbi:unnamed protein product [Penicillium bialowiezense]
MTVKVKNIFQILFDTCELLPEFDDPERMKVVPMLEMLMNSQDRWKIHMLDDKARRSRPQVLSKLRPFMSRPMSRSFRTGSNKRRTEKWRKELLGESGQELDIRKIQNLITMAEEVHSHWDCLDIALRPTSIKHFLTDKDDAIH